MALDVYLSGRLVPGADPAKAIAALAKMTGLPEDKARELLASGKARLAKRGLAEDAAQALVAKFMALGIAAEVKKAEQAEAAPPVPRPDAPPPSRSRDMEASGAHNPYAPPQSDLRQGRSTASGEWQEQGRVVPARHGIRWIREAWQLFTAQPGTWIGAIFLECLLLGLTSFLLNQAVPYAGSLAQNLLTPIFVGGFALMAHAQKENEAMGVGMLFDGFRQHLIPLLLIGVFVLLYAAGVGLLFGGGVAVGAGLLAQASLPIIVVAILLAVCLGAALFLPPILALVAAPVLVAVAGQRTVPAMKRSARALIRNWRACLINGLALYSPLVVVGLLAISMMKMLAQTPALIPILMGLAFLATLPIMLLSPCMTYVAMRDLFYEED